MISRQVLGNLNCIKSDINHREIAPRKTIVSTISSLVEITNSSESATIILPNGTTLYMEDALSNNRSKRNLLNFKIYAINGTILRY